MIIQYLNGYSTELYFSICGLKIVKIKWNK
jgi:hypothetical protein